MDLPLTIDGASTTMYLAKPSGGAGAPVLLFHPWWGLNDDVRGLADRLAGEGFTVGAPDLFRGETATTVEDAERLSSGSDEAFCDAAALSALDALLAGAVGRRAAAIGMSFGAPWALWLPAQRSEVVATILYYGTMLGPSLARSRAPILGHFAGSDPYETDEGVAAFEEACRDAGRDVQLHRYPGTGHWFAEPSRDAYDPAASDLAFDRTVAFLREHLGT